jgi:peptide-methionine (S)-S-oxide reductase
VTTGHVEVVRLQFDAALIRLEQILEIFFHIHEPTTLNRQGADVGSQYRSGIYYENAEHAEIARRMLLQIKQSNLFGKPVVTELLELTNYCPAEDYHQDYFENHPGQGYCAFVVGPKVEKFQKTFRSLLKSNDSA